MELREQFTLADGVSQSMTPFISKMRSQQTGRVETVTLPTQGPITKVAYGDTNTTLAYYIVSTSFRCLIC